MDRPTKSLILLNMLQNIGCIRLKTLLEKFKIPEAIFDASVTGLKEVKGIGETIAESIKAAHQNYDIDRELMLIEKNNIKIITIFDDNYPENLKEIYDAPILLYVKGELKQQDNIAVGVVGSRRCTQYGIKAAAKIAGELTFYGITVVSGLARGIDTSAHKGALESGGRTIAVLGNGLVSVYPPENKNLADNIVKNGALVSEFPMEMPPHKINFPKRNRIISGLSKGIVVVEAAKKSGALITADFAMEEGKEVFAVPGNIGNIASEGTNNLIRDGAKLIETAKDVAEELGISTDINKETPGEDIKKPVLSNAHEIGIYGMLSDDPCNIDTIIEELSLEPKKVKAALLNLEMKGAIQQLPGKLYVKGL